MPGPDLLAMLLSMTGMLKLLGLAGGAFLLLVLVLALGQTALLFPRWAMGPGPRLPDAAEPLALTRDTGAVLHGNLLRAPMDHGRGRPLVLGFGGNAWDANAVVLVLREALPGHDVASFHYRGYAPSTGRPSAAAILADALAVHDFLQAREGPRPILAVGFSIGTGPAAHLAAARGLAGVVLVTPFDSLHAVARAHYPWLPVDWLFRHRMEPARDLAGSAVPVALIRAMRDAVIPSGRAEALGEALTETVPGVVFSHALDAGHNELYERPGFGAALREAVA